MNLLYLTIIVVSSFMFSNINTVFAEPVSGEVLFMKSNSVAHLHFTWDRMPPQNETINVEKQIYTSFPNVAPATTSDLTMTANPSSVNLNDITQVTYTITAKNNLKGIYAISRDMVTGCGLVPLVIGLDQSEIDPSILRQFFTAIYTCPAIPPTHASQSLSDGIISKVISVDTSKSASDTTTFTGSQVPPIIRPAPPSPRILDSSDTVISGPVLTGQQIQIVGQINNTQDHDQPFAYLVQIQDSKGVTVSLSWITGTLMAGQSFKPAQSWTPTDTGTYTAQIFVWQSISNPNALSAPTSVQINVTNNLPIPITINENTTLVTNTTQAITKLVAHNNGGSKTVDYDSSSGKYNFAEIDYFSGNVGQIKLGSPVQVSISDPYDMFIHKVTVPSKDIAHDGSFNFTFTFHGKIGQDVYTLDFVYGNQTYSMQYVPVPPLVR